MQMRLRHVLPLHSSTRVETRSLSGAMAPFLPFPSSSDRVLMRPDLGIYSLGGCGGTIKGLDKANVG